MPAERSAAHTEARDPFADDVLERLIRSNQDYQREHGNYIVPLAKRLLAAREDNERLRAALEELLDVAQRIRGGDTKMNPERWFAARDYAKVVLEDGR